jgi:tryptophan synthase alpha chain
MPTRIERAFAAAREQRRPALVAFVTGGDPDLARSEEVLLALERGGADVLEVGVPFSDPVADGPVIQRSSERALLAGATLDGVIALCARVRPRLAAPLVLFTYLNPILRLGLSRFMERASRAGVDGLLVVDLPVEESAELSGMAREAGLDRIQLVSPTTTDERLAAAARSGSGFLYAISSLGVTGARKALGEEARWLVERARRATDLPVAVGFGISHPDQVREVGGWADGVVVGSSIVNVVAETGPGEAPGPRVEAHVRWLLGGEAPGRGGRQ